MSERQRFFNEVRLALADLGPTSSPIAIFSIDLDRFQSVNDSHGYERGDEVMAIVADRLGSELADHASAIGTATAVAMVGGDEFLAMCTNVHGEAAATAIATGMLDALSLPIDVGSALVALTATVGVGLSDNDSEPEALILDAVAAQRHAKRMGGARYELFTAKHRPGGAARSSVVVALQQALAGGEFRLLYQPKISLVSNRIIGVEALLRWEHPRDGLIMPGEFIPTAERSGEVVPIGAWVLHEAFRQAAIWHGAYPKTPLQIAVNISARQFRTGLALTLREAIAAAGTSADNVCLEMTETTIMDEQISTMEVLEELESLGFTLSVDDFGTGHSSLDHLHRMPIDEVKVDRSFVAGLGTDAVNTAIVASIVSLAHAMGLQVVAEGVETLDQLERLRALGCDFAQGYFIARPIRAEEIDEYLAAATIGEELPMGDPTGGVVRPTVAETVLVVDDSTEVRMLARMSLTMAGFEVEEAGSGAAALALARRLAPDCVLLGSTMPDMTGIEVCGALRNDPSTADCTIVMLTADADAADKAEAFLVGADDYIVKPFVPRDLVSRVRAAVRRRQTKVGTLGRRVDAALLELLHTVREQDRSETVLSDAEAFSARQVEIVERLLGGERVPAIARALFVSQSTVRNHLSAVYLRLGVHSQQELLDLLHADSDAPAQ